MLSSISSYWREASAWTVSQFGNSRQMQVVAVLAGVLALDAADKGALSVTAVQIQHYFHISKTDFGALGSITTGVGAVATLPFGLLVDRTVRTRLLAICVGVWAFAMLLSGVAPTYGFLIGARVILGIITAVAYPAIASLLGDYFMPANRGRAYGWVLSGELLGTGLGIVMSGGAASLFSTWRAAEFVMALPAALVVWALIKLPEPKRGVLERKAQEAGETEESNLKRRRERNPVYEMIDKKDIKPKEELVLETRPRDMNLWQAVVYALKVKTNLIIIAATALGYFFFTGLSYFAIQFVEQHYHVSRAGSSGYLLLIGIGAVAGVIASGRFSDWWMNRGHYNSRIIIPAITYFIAAILIAIGVYTKSIAIAVIFFMFAAFFFEASNPPLDAARLDIMPPSLWGRAESTRTVFIGSIEALAPITFGLVSDSVFPGANSLEYTFLIMLIPLVISSAVLIMAVKTYGNDVATTAASIDKLVTDSALP